MPRLTKIARELVTRGLPLSLADRLARGVSPNAIREMLVERFPKLTPTDMGALMSMAERAVGAGRGLVEGTLSADQAAELGPVMGRDPESTDSPGRWNYSFEVPWQTDDGSLSGRIRVRITSDKQLTYAQLYNRGFDYWSFVQEFYPERFGGVDVTQLVVGSPENVTVGRIY